MRPRWALNPGPPSYMSGALPSELLGPTSSFQPSPVQVTSMILENLAEPEWISVPCQDKVLTDIVCVKELNLKQNKTINFAQIDVNLKLTLFLCKNDEFISSSRQCDGIKDCTGGEDDANCLCYINGVTVSDSHYCRNVCQDPKCSCADLFLSNNMPGCHKYE